MEKHMIEIHKHLSHCIIINLLLLFLISFWLFIHDEIFYFIFVILTLSLAFFIFLKQNQQKRQLTILIRNCDHIIDEKPLTIMDGEGVMAILSSKIDILAQRYKAGIEALHQEKQTLREQIDNLSHQLKTPLTAMQITEELLMEDNLSDKNQVLLKNLYSQTTHLSQLIEQLLKLSRVESETIAYDFENHSFIDILSEVENSLSSLLSRSNVQIHYPANDVTIRCDKTWMMEALENIIKNSIEKTANQPIDITISQSEFTQTILIQDHGLGIQEENPEKIFERFYHGKQSKGAGIGLCLSKEIIQAHHGSIHVKNNLGAQFMIQLPIYQTKEPLKVTEKKE